MCRKLWIGSSILVLLAFLFFAASADSADPSASPALLYPVLVKDLWGYMNADGEIVIAPSFYSASPFRGDVAAVGVAGNDGIIRQGLIDAAGQFLVQPVWKRIEDGYDGFQYGGEYGFYWICDDDGQAGYYDIGNHFFCEPKFGDIFLWDNVGLLPAKNAEGKSGFVDRKTGEWAIAPQYDSLLDELRFSEGYALVAFYDEDPVRVLLINEQGDELAMPEGVSPQSAFYDGLAKAYAEGKYGYINKTGTFVISPVWEHAYPFSFGVAVVSQNDQYVLIDIEGKILTEEKWRRISDPQNGFLLVTSNSGLYGYLNLDGSIAIEPRFGYAIDFMDNGVAWVWKKGLAGLINKKGELLCDFQYELPALGWPDFKEGLQAVSIDGKWGYIDQTGEPVIAIQFDYAEDFHHGLARIYLGNQSGYIDPEGNVIRLFSVK